MSLHVLLSSERRMPVGMALVFLPWIAVVLFTAGSWAALTFFGYAIMVFAAGYSIVSVALPTPTRTQNMVLAPAVGILAISALTAFWLRLGLPLVWVPALWLGLMAAGAPGLWSDRALWAKSTVAYGGTLVILSVLICAVYFLPAARNDAVLRCDGLQNTGEHGSEGPSRWASTRSREMQLWLWWRMSRMTAVTWSAIAGSEPRLGCSFRFVLSLRRRCHRLSLAQT